MSVINELLQGIELPKMVKVRQKFDRVVIEDIPAAVRNQLARTDIAKTVKPGMRIAITAGSRGIANIHIILREIVAVCKERGAQPFIIPAMGSHGGATVAGQLEVLSGYLIKEEIVGCPIIASMEITQIGTLDNGRPLFIDKHASAADGIIVVNRIKAHTGFRGKYESGLVKMMAIGLAKQIGAEECHKEGLPAIAVNVERYGLGIHKHSKILFGLAILENAYEETAQLTALTYDEIPEEEPKLLQQAKAAMAKIKLPSTDILVVDEIGKDISGDGMDPNVTGRWTVDNIHSGLVSKRIVVLDIRDNSHNNGNGIGLADFTTMRAFKKFDREKSYPNVLTSTAIKNCFMPLILDNDRQAIQAAVKTSSISDWQNLKIIRIKNTLELGEFYVSESHIQEVRQYPDIEIVSEPTEWDFDANGNLF
ncbi:lactate racemase domain-containing protein [Sporomusa aerivorans]|uniref:lactate racemase domain-containing protein n=1 Tax=Sporomusa aerivorans TaxID=204936 RepID=UPI00352B808C